MKTGFKATCFLLVIQIATSAVFWTDDPAVRGGIYALTKEYFRLYQLYLMIKLHSVISCSLIHLLYLQLRSL
jgi:hypothetical protein